jgi:ribose transport system substrate-binding protein
MSDSRRGGYVVRSVVHATQVLRAFESAGEALRLRDIVERTGLGKGLCFRLLHTLHHVGLVEKVDAAHYRLTSEVGRRRRYRIGYAAQGQDTSFPREVLGGLQRAADRENVELIVVDNRYQAKTALRNAEHLVRERVDLVIEFQTDEAVASAIAAKYLGAHIPLIAIDVPHPGATYFGANNYQAGLLAGRHLGQWAKTRHQGRVDELLLLELGRAGSLVHARMSGAVAGLRETLRDTLDACPTISIDCDGQFKLAMEKVRKRVRESSARYVLVVAANDPSALGAARAYQEAGRSGTCAIVGHNGEPDARAELREPRTPLVASVGFFPERYGDGVLKLALDILGHRPAPPALFVHHQLITPANVNHIYPNDALLAGAQSTRG